jgi:transcriptional regulator with XRE-family HTH domain
LAKTTFSTREAEEDQKSPSEVFASRLREIRKARDLSQTELARRMTEEGRPMNKAALLRIENGQRGLSLDEALALAELLKVAPAHLLSPPDDAMVWLTDNRGVDGAGMRNWLLFGDPLLLNPPGRRFVLRAELVGAIEVYAQAIIDAKNGRDEEGRKHAIRALEAAIMEHNTAISQVADEEES